MYLGLFYLAIIGVLVSSIFGFCVYKFLLEGTKIQSFLKYILGALFSLTLCFLLGDFFLFCMELYT